MGITISLFANKKYPNVSDEKYVAKKKTGSSFDNVFAKTIGVLKKGNFLNFLATLKIWIFFVGFIFINDIFKYATVEMKWPEINAKNSDIKEGFIMPKTIISDWVDRTWYTLAFEKWLNSFFLRRLYLIISKSPKKNTPIGISQNVSIKFSALSALSKMPLVKQSTNNNIRQNDESASKQRMSTLLAILSFSGSTIAISYLKQEITPKIVIIDKSNWYFPSIEAENILVIIGSTIATTNAEIIVLVDIFKTLLKKSFVILLL